MPMPTWLLAVQIQVIKPTTRGSCCVRAAGIVFQHTHTPSRMTGRVILAHGPDRDVAVVAEQLDRHGFETRRAHDGEALIALADAWEPNAAVIELGLQRRPALAAASALRNRFGGDIQLVGFTVPSAPELEKHALDAGFDHVVVEVRNAAEVLLALSAHGALLVRRARFASFAFAATLIDFARASLDDHAALPEAYGRGRNIAMLRRTIEAIARCAHGDGLDEKQAAAVRLALSELESRFQRLVRSRDGHGIT